MAAVISSIYNSIKRMKGEEGVHSLCSSRGLASQLLLSISPSTKNATGTSAYATTSSSAPTTLPTTSTSSTTPITGNTSTATNTTTTATSTVGNAATTASSTTTATAVNKKDNSNDPVLEWLHILFFHLLQSDSNRLLQLFKTLQPRAVGESVWDFKTDSSDNNLFFEEKLSEMELNDRAVLTHEQVLS